jgi:hypothetical protein
MAKFIVGVLVGLFLGASASAYGAVATGAGTLSNWTVINGGVDVCPGPSATEACGTTTGLSPGAQLSLDKPRFRGAHPCW